MAFRLLVNQDRIAMAPQHLITTQVSTLEVESNHIEEAHPPHNKLVMAIKIRGKGDPSHQYNNQTW
jgi:hypothetical protein